jgi:hypothetical protein
MPNFDGTGPRGEGPGTGLGQGPCVYGSGFGRRRFGAGRGYGRFGRGRGFGRGAGICPFFNSQPIDENDAKSLSTYAQELQDELKEVQSLLKKKS